MSDEISKYNHHKFRFKTLQELIDTGWRDDMIGGLQNINPDSNAITSPMRVFFGRPLEEIITSSDYGYNTASRYKSVEWTISDAMVTPLEPVTRKKYDVLGKVCDCGAFLRTKYHNRAAHDYECSFLGD